MRSERGGLDEIRVQIERSFARSESFSVTLDSNIVVISGAVAWIASDVTITFKVPGADAMSFPARSTTVMQEHDGR